LRQIIAGLEKRGQGGVRIPTMPPTHSINKTAARASNDNGAAKAA
jgi:hypothetical protein